MRGWLPETKYIKQLWIKNKNVAFDLMLSHCTVTLLMFNLQNEYIDILESKIAMLEASRNLDQIGQVEHMRQQCRALQDQVDEMEASTT